MLASVIVPTHNRKEAVERCLLSLFAQDLPAGDFEILIVDDGSTDGTAKRLAEVAEEAGRSVRVITQDHKGPAAARNAGAREARGEVLAFLDSDTIAHSAWLREGMVPLAEAEVAGVEGRTMIPAGEGGGPFARRIQNPFGRRFLGCNLIFRKEEFERAGRFDERFGLIPFREDTDLAHRVLERGGRIAFAPAALITHPSGQGTWRTPLLQAWRYRNDPLLFRKDWKTYLLRVDVHQIGLISIWKPRIVLYLVYLFALPMLLVTGGAWAAGATAAALMGILLIHLHKFAPKETQPHEIILLFPVCALVPFVFLAAVLTGAVSGPSTR
ncbi:MAG: glycosyltransferase family 2 protein [Planctomycetota bacterium]|nr:glycosyltransferase family 2 protein [Planctomycetota bacterium]